MVENHATNRTTMKDDKSGKPDHIRAPFTEEQIREAETIRDKVFRKDFVMELRTYSWKPEKQHREIAKQLYREKYEARYGEKLPDCMLELNLTFMAARRFALGRSVQPTGELDDMAPVIGAVRLKGMESQAAAEWVGRQTIAALENGDDGFLKRLKRFSAATLGDHRNYQVWVAIGQMLESGKFEPSKMLTADLQKEIPDWNQPMKFFPNSAEVRQYVIRNRANGVQGFGNMPGNQDTGGWSRLWSASGADAFIELHLGGCPPGSKKPIQTAAKSARKRPRMH